jgi:hypothetical protein
VRLLHFLAPFPGLAAGNAPAQGAKCIEREAFRKENSQPL